MPTHDEFFDLAQVPTGVARQEAEFLLRLVARLKKQRFGRIVVSVSDGRLVDVEIVERVHREILNSM